MGGNCDFVLSEGMLLLTVLAVDHQGKHQHPVADAVRVIRELEGLLELFVGEAVCVEACLLWTVKSVDFIIL